MSKMDEKIDKIYIFGEDYDMEKNSKNIFKSWKLWIGILIAILIIIFILNYNTLSKQETVEKFLYLVSESEYQKAKKYITSNFEWDLASVKKKELEYKESFTYKYGDYYLKDDYDIAYIYINMEDIKWMAIYKFKLKHTILGYKIDNYDYEYTDY